jgi:hypothetical protein
VCWDVPVALGTRTKQRVVAVVAAAGYLTVAAVVVSGSGSPWGSEPTDVAANASAPRAAGPDPRSLTAVQGPVDEPTSEEPEPAESADEPAATPAPGAGDDRDRPGDEDGSDDGSDEGDGSGDGDEGRAPPRDEPSTPARPTPAPTTPRQPAPAPAPDPDAPRVTSFTASANGPCLILLGRESVTLRWSSVNASRGEIRSPSGLPTWVGANGSLLSCGRSGEAFRLTVTGPEGEATASAVVP